jgi:hypothetical protein
MPDTTPDSKRDAAKDARAKDFSAAKADKSSPKKRRKVNHGKLHALARTGTR